MTLQACFMVGLSAILVVLIPSDERQRHKLNGLLCVDTLTGEEFLRPCDKAKTEDVSLYLAEFCRGLY